MTKRAHLRGSLAIVLLATGAPALPVHAQGEPSGEFAAAFAEFANLPERGAIPEGAIDISAIEPAPYAEEIGTGMASWYGPNFAGRSTANGERFDPQQLTAAHPTLPFGSLVRVTYLDTGRSVVVRINDRGPFAQGRVIDLSEAAAREIGLIDPGHGEVSLALIAE